MSHVKKRAARRHCPRGTIRSDNNIMVMGSVGSVGQSRRSRVDENGYIMVVLLIGMAVTAVLMTASLPAWRQQAQREHEIDLIFRGEQYARAIALYYKRTQTLPPDFDVLVTGHYLRKKWKDPITNEDFLPIMSGGAPAPPGSSAAPVGQGPGGVPAPVGPGSTGRTAPLVGGGTPGRTGPGPAGPAGQPGPAGPGGAPQGGQQVPVGLAGVVSKSAATSILIYNQLQQHNLWQFTYQTACQRTPSLCPATNNQQNNRQQPNPGPARGPGTQPAGGPGGLTLSPGGGRTPPPAAGRGSDLGLPPPGTRPGRGGG
jgi:type II secretory pathway pseudopilin PulG